MATDPKEPEPIVPEVAAAELLSRAAERRFLLGLTGIPGSGKSTLAAALASAAQRLAGPAAATVVPMDGFHLTNAELDARGWRSRKGAPWTFDVAGFVALLQELRTATGDVWAPLYDRALHDPVSRALLVSAVTHLVIVEGNWLLLDEPPWDQVRPLLDEVWFVELPTEVALERLRLRHLKGGSSPAEAAAKIERNDRPNAVRILNLVQYAHRHIMVSES
jgi:pantothenate kinase